MSTTDLPDIAGVLAQVIQRVPVDRVPLLLAIAERLAAQRYRDWADAAPEHRDGLLACAAREEEIAGRIEALDPNAAAVQRQIQDANPELLEINRTLFAGRPLAQQFAIQAQGERLGAATWRSFARQVPAARDTFLACAALEESSASFLESL